jgi:hypothetical protein
MKFVVAEKITPQGTLLVITDKEIIGKKYEEGKKQLDLANKFYLGEEIDIKEIEAKLEDAYVIHFTGKNAVALGKKFNLIDENKIIIIANIPHAEVLIDKN